MMKLTKIAVNVATIIMARAEPLPCKWIDFERDVKDEKIWEYKELNTTSQFLCACGKVLTISLGY